MARLEAAEAAEAAEAQLAAETTEAEREAGAERAAQEAASGQKPETDTTTDTPAGAEAKPDTETTKPANEQGNTDEAASDSPPGDKPAEGSRFKKNKERLHKTWDSVNQRKTELDTVKQGLDERAKALEAQAAEFARKRQQFEEGRRITPEKYEAFAGQMRSRADQLRQEADRLEDADKLGEAKAKRVEATDAESDARKALKMAEETRRNPPPTDEQQAKAVEAKRREWTLKAAVDFPGLAKDGGDFQKAVAGNLRELQAQSPEYLEHPDVVYHVARLTAAETTAARVPVLEKELGQLRAKVKEYESLTALTGGSIPQGGGGPSGPRTEAQEEAELRQEAAAMGAIPR